MIGYMIEQELGNLLPFEVPFATLLTMIEVDAEDPGFKNPTKFVGPVYDKSVADWVAQEKGWVFKADGDTWRRVVPSPEPKRIFEIRPIRWLLEKGVIVIAAALPGIALGCLLAQQAPAQDRPSPTVSNRYIPAPAERLGSLEQQKAYSYRNRLSAQQRSMELDRALNRNQRIWRAFVSESAYGSGSIWFPKQVGPLETCITLPMPG